jgi:aspartate beta-hydroxylase
MSMPSRQGETRLRELWQWFEQGRLQEAWHAASAWRSEPEAPADLDLLLANIAMAQGRPAQAIALYQTLAATDSELRIPARMGWAAALSATGDDTSAMQVLEVLLAQTPTHFIAQLRLAEFHEKQGRHERALIGYYAAVIHAQRQGRWLGEDTTAPPLRPRVRHAMEYIDGGRQRLFLSLLEPLRAQYGRDALDRVERGLKVYLGELPAQYADASQRPTFFYVPDVPAEPYPSRALFPWLQELEQATDAIRTEMLATREDGEAYAPFLGKPADALPAGLLAGSGGAPAWDAYFFYRHGVRDEARAQACAATTAAIERAPLVHIRDHAPEICFSVLAPGSHILPHRGVTNTRLTVHLPLIVPGDCALLAGGMLHEWKEGHAMVFDDTFEHEAWNRSDSTRVILLMDTWNPHLQPVEREAVTRLVEAIGDFNAAASVP